MLCLSRTTGEVVVMTLPDGRQVRVLVCEVDRGKVRLGFAGPPDVQINRLEVQDRIDARATAAAVLGGGT